MSQSAIFVSHSSADRATCELFVGALNDAGFDAWSHEHDNNTLDSVPELVGAQFNRRPTFLILLSPDALASRWVQREWDMALSRSDKDLILVTVAPLTADLFIGRWSLAAPMRRIEASGYQPLPPSEAIAQVFVRLDTSIDMLLDRGKEKIRNNDYAGAIPVLRAVTAARPDNVSGWSHLAYAQMEVGACADALAACERALILQPNRADIWNTKGWALNRLQLHATALVATERAIALDGGYAYMWNTYSEALQGLGRLDEALAASERATKLDPDWRWGWVQKAEVLRKLGKLADADLAESRASGL